MIGRVSEHVGEEKFGYLTHALLIIDSDNSFGPIEISYLEKAFYNQAKEVGRVGSVNGNEPSLEGVTKEKKAELDEFITNAKILIRALGYRAFDPIDDTGSAASVAEASVSTGDEPLHDDPPGYSTDEDAPHHR